jgi:hypothetical protein
VLKKEAEAFEDHTRDLATAGRPDPPQARQAHRRHAVRHPAAGGHHDRLFSMACVLSRVDGSVRRLGEDGAARELEILRVFSGQVQRRVKSNYGKIDDNDDELIKSLADHAFAEERFIWDNLPS